MEAVQRDYWYSLALLIFLIILKASLQKSDDETVRLEDGMMLDCLCPWDGNLSMVSWTKIPDRNPIAVYHPRFGANLAVGYSDRLAFLKRTSMDGSISFANVTEEDAGLYHCSMQTFPLGTWTRDIQVVKENFLPHFKVTFKEGENVTLVCPRYNYTVSQVLIKKDDQEDIIGRCIQQSGPFVLKDQHDTIRVSCADPIHGVTFELNNVVKEDEGRYRCLISTEYGVEIFTYEVTVGAQDELQTPTSGPEEAAGSFPTLQQVQVLEDLDPAEGIPITEMPALDAAYGVTDSLAPTEGMFTTDSTPSASTNSVHRPTGPVEGMPITEVASVKVITMTHPLAPSEGMASTESPPSIIATTMSHPPDPGLTDGMSTTKLVAAVITSIGSGQHLPERCRSPPLKGPCRGSYPVFYYDTTTQSCESFIYGGCRGNSNKFLTLEECESTCRTVPGPSEGMSELTTEMTLSVIATTLPHPAGTSEGLSPTEAAPSFIATTAPLLPATSEGPSTRDSTPSVIEITVPPRATSEGLSTTDSTSSVIEITVPSPVPSKEASSTEPAASIEATTVPHPPEPSEGTEPPPSAKATTVPHPTDGGFFPDIPEEYWIYIYAGAGAFGLLLLLIIIIILICCHRRRKRREAYRVKLHPGRRWRDSEQGGFYDRMRKGTRWGRQEPIYANVRTGQKYKYKPKQKRKR